MFTPSILTANRDAEHNALCPVAFPCHLLKLRVVDIWNIPHSIMHQMSSHEGPDLLATAAAVVLCSLSMQRSSFAPPKKTKEIFCTYCRSSTKELYYAYSTHLWYELKKEVNRTHLSEHSLCNVAWFAQIGAWKQCSAMYKMRNHGTSICNPFIFVKHLSDRKDHWAWWMYTWGCMTHMRHELRYLIAVAAASTTETAKEVNNRPHTSHLMIYANEYLASAESASSP